MRGVALSRANYLKRTRYDGDPKYPMGGELEAELQIGFQLPEEPINPAAQSLADFSGRVMTLRHLCYD
jgi:hypothetical protein